MAKDLQLYPPNTNKLKKNETMTKKFSCIKTKKKMEKHAQKARQWFSFPAIFSSQPYTCFLTTHSHLPNNMIKATTKIEPKTIKFK